MREPAAAPSRLLFWSAIAALIGFKFWLIHGEEIIGSATQYDALWYVRSASHWYWGTPYSWVAFIRPCAYPLFIALAHALHFPLRLAIEFLQIGGALILTLALRQWKVSRAACVFGFAVICLHPAGYQLNNYSMSDTFYAGMLWWVLGGLLFTLAGFRWWTGLLTGLAMGVLWHAREEGIILVGLLVVWSAVSCWRAGMAKALRPIFILTLTVALVVVGLSRVNRAVYGSFARSEMSAPVFDALFHSLLRIRPNESKRYVPITTETLRKAFEVSPTFASLQPQFEGALGNAWRTETFLRRGIRGEIGAGWIVWATRQAAGTSGYFSSPKKSHRFAKKIASEINQACDEGRLPTRFVLDGFLDPLAQSGGLAALPQSIQRVTARFFARWEIKSIPDDEILTADEAALYDRMTLRKSAGVGPRSGLAFAGESFFARYYFVLALVLHGAALCSLGLLFYSRRAGNFTGAILLLGAAVLSRVLLFSWLDATAFDGTEDRFLFPILPLWMLTLTVLCAAAFEVWRSRLHTQS